MSNTSETLEYRASEHVRQRLTAMMLDLLANGAILDELLNCYKMFHFTGGDVPRARWRLVAIASYLEDPFASDRIGTSEAERYRDLAEEITALGQTVAAGRPRTVTKSNRVSCIRARSRWVMRRCGAAAAKASRRSRSTQTE